MSILHYLQNMGLVMLCLLPLWALVRLVFLKKTGRNTSPGREALLALFVLYLAALASQTVCPRVLWNEDGLALLFYWDNGGGANYIPFATIRHFLTSGTGAVTTAINLAGNVAVFVPLGLLPPLLWPKLGRGWTVALGAGCSGLIELVQPLVGRQRDIDDLILNTLGAALGWLLFLALKRLRPGKGNDHEHID